MHFSFMSVRKIFMYNLQHQCFCCFLLFVGLELMILFCYERCEMRSNVSSNNLVRCHIILILKCAWYGTRGCFRSLFCIYTSNTHFCSPKQFQFYEGFFSCHIDISNAEISLVFEGKKENFYLVITTKIHCNVKMEHKRVMHWSNRRNIFIHDDNNNNNKYMYNKRTTITGKKSQCVSCRCVLCSLMLFSY